MRQRKQLPWRIRWPLLTIRERFFTPLAVQDLRRDERLAGLPKASTRAWIFVVNPPRDQPIA
jgi:hypothetical protein